MVSTVVDLANAALGEEYARVYDGEQRLEGEDQFATTLNVVRCSF